jgi:hypothetical protein
VNKLYARNHQIPGPEMKRILRNSKKNFLQDPGRNLSRNFTWEE